MFGSRSNCGGGCKTYLVSHATFRDYVIKESCDFMGGTSLLYVKTLPDLVTIDVVVVEICFSFMA